MAKTQRPGSGRNRQQAGKKFEQYFEFACFRQNWSYVPIPQGVKWIPGVRGVRAQPVKSPFDCVISKDGAAGFFDTKTINEGNFGHSLMKKHQIDALYNLHSSGQVSGYIIWFRKIDKVIFYDAGNLLRAFVSGKSLTPDSGFNLGPIESFEIKLMFKGRLVDVIPGQEGRSVPGTEQVTV